MEENRTKRKPNKFFLEKGDKIKYFQTDVAGRLACISYRNGGMGLEEALEEVRKDIYTSELEFVEYKNGKYYFLGYVDDAFHRSTICYTTHELTTLYRINLNIDVWLRWYKTKVMLESKIEK